MSDEIRVLDLAYRLAPGDAEWLHELTEEVARMSGAAGVLAMQLELDDETCTHTGKPVLWGDMPEQAFAFTQYLHQTLPHTLLHKVYAAPDCAHLSDIIRGLDVSEQWLGENLPWFSQAAGQPDAWRLTAGNPNGSSVLFACKMDEQGQRRFASDNARWKMLAAHVASAHRLRRRFVPPRIQDAEAVFESNGQLRHVEGVAEAHREQLGRAVQTLLRMRGRALTAGQALDAWTALLEGRWSIV